MPVWVFNDPNPESKEFVSRSLKEGISRFGWSWFDSANLKTLELKSWSEMSEEEVLVWKKSSFLLNIKAGDWIVHINIPYWGFCSAAQVKEGYQFDQDGNEISDFRHFLKIDVTTLIEFDRNADEIHPMVSNKLKLRGRYWRIYAENEFFASIENLIKGTSFYATDDTKGLHYLKEELSPLWSEITSKIQRTHPEKKLEYFLANVLRNVPNVTEVKVNGSGWGTDFGADIIVKYIAGLGLLNLQKEETLVVQVKSYTGIHEEVHCVEQLKTAIEKFKAEAALLITTAKASEQLEKALEALSAEIEKPVELIAGDDVAKFVLSFGKGVVI